MSLYLNKTKKQAVILLSIKDLLVYLLMKNKRKNLKKETHLVN